MSRPLSDIAAVEAGAFGVRDPLPGVVYPPTHELAEYLSTGALRCETLISALERSFSSNAKRTAIDGPEGPLSYADLDALSSRAAAGFAMLGLVPLDRVVFQLPNGRDLLVAVLGCLKAGLIPVCTLLSHREVEIRYLAEHAGARAHIVQGDDPKFDFVPFAQDIRSRVPSLEHIIVAGKTITEGTGIWSFDRLVACQDDQAARSAIADITVSLDPFQVAFFELSGGTTGVPKIIPRLQNEYLYNMECVAAFNRMVREDVVLCPGPMLHNAPMVCFWGPALLVGATVLTDHDLTVEGLKSTFHDRRPTWGYLPRPLLARMKEALAGLEDRSFIRGMVTSGDIVASRRELDIPVFPLFGMTEGVIMFAREDDPAEAIHSSVGRPVSPYDRIKLLVPGSESLVEEGQTGELAIKGPYTIHGYFDAADRNREAFTSDGFYRSGDLLSGRWIGGNIFYSFHGRIKDVIDRGGEKINCEEVERHVRTFPGVRDVALVGMPHKHYGEKGCAFVIVAPGYVPPNVKSLGDHLQQIGLAKFKWPEHIMVIDAFPVTTSQKLDKGALRRRAAEAASELAREEVT